MDRHIYTAVCKIDSECETAVQHKELSLVFSDDLYEWDGRWEEGARRKRYMYT